MWATDPLQSLSCKPCLVDQEFLKEGHSHLPPTSQALAGHQAELDRTICLFLGFWNFQLRRQQGIKTNTLTHSLC